MATKDELEREMAFARSLVNQLIDEITEQRKRLVKHPRPKDQYFEYEVWFNKHHIDHLRDALNAYKPRGKKQKLTCTWILANTSSRMSSSSARVEMDNE